MSERCETCAFWKRWNQRNPKDEELGSCGIISMGDPAVAEPAFIEADADDDSGLEAQLVTCASFGCTWYRQQRSAKYHHPETDKLREETARQRLALWTVQEQQGAVRTLDDMLHSDNPSTGLDEVQRNADIVDELAGTDGNGTRYAELYGLSISEVEEIMESAGYERCPDCGIWIESCMLTDDNNEPCACPSCMEMEEQ